MSSEEFELAYAKKEAARNERADMFFAARPKLDTPENRRLFLAGFDRGYNSAMDHSTVKTR